MQNTLLLVCFIVLILLNTVSIIMLFVSSKTQKTIIKNQTLHNTMLTKIQSTLKSKNATNVITENADMVYNDLVQNLIPIMATMNAMPRNTNEHQLWRALGGIMDEYDKNPFALEKLRRGIKLDSSVARSVENFIRRADSFMQYLTLNEPEGLLASTFTDGLLGKATTFFAQAQQLANQEN